jgi:hypothetical protein
MNEDQLVTAEPILRANDEVIAKEVAELLLSNYPGYLWAVAIDSRPTVCMLDIRNLSLSGKWGFRFPLDEYLDGMDTRRKVIRAGGEMLERYRMPRGRFSADHYAQIPTDRFGNFKADL